MINLRKMKADEYPAYCDYFIADYGDDLTQNHGHSIEMATKLAQQALLRSFPDGVESKQHDLLCIELNSNGILTVIGYLWHSIKVSDASTFIYDFYIQAEYRGSGYGKQAIGELENLLAAINIEQIQLRVAFNNQRALALYEEVGFTISGYNMSKKIPSK